MVTGWRAVVVSAARERETVPRTTHHTRNEGPLLMRTLREIDRFWSKVDIKSGCWEWKAAVDKDGYGHFSNHRAHRYAYALANGPIPAGLVVMHSCDNPPCVRPDHLIAGTQAENNRDRATKGRSAPRKPCSNGCADTPENWRIFPHRRVCIPCDRRRAREYKARQRVAA